MKDLDAQLILRTCPSCLCCGADGVVAYEDLQDRLFQTGGRWCLKRCDNPECGLMWLDPMPGAEDLAGFYKQYYTHQDQAPPAATSLRRLVRSLSLGYLAGKFGYRPEGINIWHRLGGLLFHLHPGRRVRLDASVFFLPALPMGRLLEIGCGGGAQLKLLQELGWKVQGIDFDPASVANASAKGLTVHTGDLFSANHPAKVFDAVVMSHVIEHVPDPAALLKECFRILKPGGRLVSLTPNTGGWGHGRFGRNWRGLEPPRHLHLFNAASMDRLARDAGFSRVDCATTTRSWKIFLESELGERDLLNNGKAIPRGLKLQAEIREFVAGCKLWLRPQSGEELKLEGRRRDDD